MKIERGFIDQNAEPTEDLYDNETRKKTPDVDRTEYAIAGTAIGLAVVLIIMKILAGVSFIDAIVLGVLTALAACVYGFKIKPSAEKDRTNLVSFTVMGVTALVIFVIKLISGDVYTDVIAFILALFSAPMWYRSAAYGKKKLIRWSFIVSFMAFTCLMIYYMEFFGYGA